MSRLRICAAAFTVALASSVAAPLSRAETAARLPANGALASANDENPAPTIISRMNLPEYSGLVVPELHALISQGSTSLKAFKGLRYEPALAVDWLERSGVARASIDEKGVVSGEIVGTGFPFGMLTSTPGEDRAELGKKIVYNAAALALSAKLARTEISLRGVKNGQTVVDLRAIVSRAVPHLVRSDDRTVQTMREKIQFTSPRALAGYVWLTFRFLGADEDAVWIHSPAIGKTRQMTGSNRSDPFLKSSVSPDDLFGFSGKPEAVRATVLGEMQAMVPMADIDPLKLTPNAEGCLERTARAEPTRAEHVTAPVLRNDSIVAADARQLFTDGTVFVPRPLWRIELAPLDPYSQYGRQILYVDRELTVPFIKVVYDRAGRLWKLVLTAFGMGVAQGTPQRVVVPAVTVVDDLLKGEQYEVRALRTVICQTSESPVSLAEFDPKNIGPGAEPNGAPAAAPAPGAAKAPPAPVETEAVDEL